MDFEDNALIIDRRILKAAAHFVSTDANERQYMQRIFIDTVTMAPQVFVVAGNGSSLAIFNCGEGPPGIPPSLVSPAAVAVIPNLKKDSQLQGVAIFGGALHYTDGDGNDTHSRLYQHQKSGDGPIYFNWRKIIPPHFSGRPGHFATNQWEPFKKARKALSLADQHPLHIGHNGNLPGVVRWPDFEDFLGLLNPLSSDEVSLPAWMSLERALPKPIDVTA